MAPDLIDIAEARRRVLAAAKPLPAEEVPLDRGLGRVLAEDVTAPHDVPPFDSSAMDGYAVIAGAGGELPVVDESRAGQPAGRRLERGQAIRISTGAVVPDGADSVVQVERVEERDGSVVVPDWEADRNIRRAAEDMRAGETILRAGTALGPAEIAVLAAAGVRRPRCGRRPRVAVLATGDELVEPGMPLRPGQIRNSNAYAVAALAEALTVADVVCVSGGVSVGPHDHVRPALRDLRVEERFWGVRLKPGKPTWFGNCGSVLVFGLPGNPVSAMVTFHLFARPALQRLAGAEPEETRASAVLDAAIALSPAREQVVRCRLAARDDGWHVEPTKEQGSHILTSMLGADAFAFVPAGEGELPVGGRVEIELV